MTHTTGPWNAISTGNHQGLIVAENGANVAVAYDKKDAPLIAAAPELLAALKDAEFLLRKIAINPREAGRMVESCKRSAADAAAAIAATEGKS